MNAQVETLRPTTVDHAAVLKSLNLNPNDPNTQALLLICERYELDPLLKHLVLIQGRPYVTRDGYLQVAHASGRLDGIEVLEEGEDASHWWARVAVHRKDMARPFVYRGRYPKQGSGNKAYGPEMAIKCAEVAALRRAFNVSGIGASDERFDADETDVMTVGEPLAALPVAASPAPRGNGDAAPAPPPASGRAGVNIGEEDDGEASPPQQTFKNVGHAAADAGLDDAGRHDLAEWASDGTTRSSRELTVGQQARAIAACADLKAGRTVLLRAEDGQVRPVSNATGLVKDGPDARQIGEARAALKARIEALLADDVPASQLWKDAGFPALSRLSAARLAEAEAFVTKLEDERPM